MLDLVLDLPGPEFLLWYGGAAIVVALIATALGGWLTTPDDDAPQKDLDAYDLAVLAESQDAAIQAAVAYLHQLTLITVESGRLHLNAADSPSALPTLHPLEQSIYDAVREAGPAGSSPTSLGSSVDEQAALIESSLVEQQLVVSPLDARLEAIVTHSLCWPLLGLGAVRLVIGLLNSRPVMFLVIMMMCIGVPLMLREGLRLSKSGKASLKGAKDAHIALKTTADVDSTQLSAADTALAVGLFGAQLIPGLAHIYKSRIAVSTAVASTGDSCSSCSSCSSCGGGGGCGGCGGCGG